MKRLPYVLLALLLCWFGYHKVQSVNTSSKPQKTKTSLVIPVPQNTPSVTEAKSRLEKTPNSPQNHYELGLAYCKEKNYTLAVKEFQQAKQLAPNIPSSDFALGLTYNSMGETEKAIEVFHNLLQQKLSQGSRFRAYFYLANSYWDAKRLPEAQAAYLKCLEYKPLQGQAEYGLGLICAYQNQLTEAKAHFLKALEKARIPQERATTNASLGKLAEQQGQTQEALIYYQSSLEQDNSNELANEGIQRLKTR